MARALCLFVAALLSVALAWWSAPSWRVPLPAPVLLVFVAAGRLWLGCRAPSLWRKLFGLLLAAIWLSATLAGLGRDLGELEMIGTSSLEPMVGYLWRLSLALGLLWLTSRENEARLNLPSSLLTTLGLSGLLLGHPRAEWLFAVPLLTAVGFFPHRGETTRQEWNRVGAEILEMVSQQAVAWTVILTLTNPLPEVAASRYFDAVITFFGTAIFGWLFSGLLWGGAVSLRAQKRDPGL